MKNDSIKQNAGFLFILFSLLLSLTSFKEGNNENNACIEPLKKCIAKMASFGKPQIGKSYFMHMNMKKDMSDKSKEKDSDVEISMVISATQMIYETATVSVYKDEQDAFTIVHPRKQIVWTKGTKMPYNDGGVLKMNAFQNSFLDQCKILSCDEKETDGKKLKELKLVPDKKFKVKNIAFSFDPSSAYITKIETVYFSGGEILSELLTIHEMDMNYKKSVPKKVRDKIFSSKGKLTATFKGYKILDQR